MSNLSEKPAQAPSGKMPRSMPKRSRGSNIANLTVRPAQKPLTLVYETGRESGENKNGKKGLLQV